MSPPILFPMPSGEPSASSPARRERGPFSTASDQFSPGNSRPNTATATSRIMDLEPTIEAWLDALSSPLSTSSERIGVLNEIEKALVRLTDPSRTTGLVGLDQAPAFWALQAMAGFSLAEVLLAHVYRLHLELERENERQNSVRLHNQTSSSPSSPSSASQQLSEPHSLSETQRQRIHSTVSEICIAITILQGLTLCSKPSKRILQRKSSLELLLQIVLSDYCTQLLPPILCPIATCILTPSSPSLPLSPPTDAPLSLPSGFSLDLLMCILVDNPLAQERFEDMGGIHQIVQLSHKCADTVTTPASTPTAGQLASFADRLGLGRSSHIVALKQTDLLCLEFRYFWSQVLQSEDRGGMSAATSFYSMTTETEGSTTPKAKVTLRKRVSTRDLRVKEAEAEEEGKVQVEETPKGARRRVTVPSTARATSEEAPTRPSASNVADDQLVSSCGSPRKLRQSRSVAELRKKPTHVTSKSTMPPVPPLPFPLPTTDAATRVATRRSRDHRPSTSGSSPISSEERMRRSTVSESTTTPIASSAAASASIQGAGVIKQFNPSRPGMSSRDRPLIPSPLKPRTPAQEASEVEQTRLRAELKANQQAIPYRRLRSSTTSTPFSFSPSIDAQRFGRVKDPIVVDAVGDGDGDGDGENKNPFAMAIRVDKDVPLHSAGRAVFKNSESRSNLAKIPPSPAVRRAQLARARSLSPTKLSLSNIGESKRFPAAPAVNF